MRRLHLTFILALLVQLSCSRPQQSRLVEIVEIGPGLHVGEYAQLRDGKLLSIVRDKDNGSSGIVEVDLAEKKISSLIAEATEAKDLYVDRDFITYRISENVFVSDAHYRPQLIVSGVEKLSGFVAAKNYSAWALQWPDNQWSIFCVRDEAAFELHQRQPGRILALNSLEDSRLIALTSGVTSQTDLLITSCNAEFEAKKIPIHDKQYSRFGQVHWLKNKLFVTYLAEEEGSLFLVEIDSTEFKPLRRTRVAGKDFESYTGMDVALFEDLDRGMPGAIFLDGESLKPQIARFDAKEYQVQTVELNAAFGFYNLPLQFDGNILSFVTHAFRYRRGNGDQSFEDWLLIRIDLR